MYERVDTSSTVEIEHDTARAAVILIGSLVVFTLAAWELWADPLQMLQSWSRRPHRAAFAMWLLVVLAAAIALLFAIQMIRLRGAVLTVSPHGICDSRYSFDTVPWSSVTDVTEWQAPQRRKVPAPRAIKLLLAAPLAEVLQLRTMARWECYPLGNEMMISASGIKASFDDIRNLITAFANAHANLDPSSSSRLVRSS